MWMDVSTGPVNYPSQKKLFLSLVQLCQAFPNHMWRMCLIKRSLLLSSTKRRRLLAKSLLKTDFILLALALHGPKPQNIVVMVDQGTLDGQSCSVARVTTRSPLKYYSIRIKWSKFNLYSQGNVVPVVFISSQL